MKAKDKPSDFRKVLERLCHSHDPRKVFDGFVRCAACAVASGTREPEYLEEAKRWNREELGGFAEAFAALVREMEAKPFEDVIGCYYMEFALSRKGAQWGGEFHTPKCICDLMARLTLGDMSHLPAEGPITVSEPACGAGAQILALGSAVPPEVRRRLRVTAVDVNRTACDMTFINTTLWGIPTRVVHGNTLSLETWGCWDNLHFIMPWLPFALQIDADEAAPVPIAAPEVGQQELQLQQKAA